MTVRTVPAEIHRLLHMGQKLESDWDTVTDAEAGLTAFRQALSQLQQFADPDLKRLGRLAATVESTMPLRRFLTILVPLERLVETSRADQEILPVPDPEEPRGSPMPVSLILDNIRSAYNTGAIFRTADCMGIDHVWLCGYTATPDEAPVRKTTMGTHAHVPWTYRPRALALMEELQATGIRVLAAETVPGDAVTPEETIWDFPGALIFGNERYGLSKDILSKADGIMTIPVYGRKNSLNLSIAAGICMRVARQKWNFLQGSG